ncbi:GAF domain-containing protein [Methylobacterium sp. P31]
MADIPSNLREKNDIVLLCPALAVGDGANGSELLIHARQSGGGSGENRWRASGPMRPYMYPLHPNEPERLSALEDLDVIYTGHEPQYDAICRLAQALFGVPIAVVSVVGETEQRFKGRCGLNSDGTPREASFCTHTILSDEIMVVEDATRDVRFAALPLVTGEPYIRFYAGAPLVLAPDIHLGALCICDRVPRTLSQEQRDQLGDLAQVVVAQLRLSRAERSARESAAGYRLLADNTTDLIVRCDLDGTRRYVSPAARGLLGYEPDESRRHGTVRVPAPGRRRRFCRSAGEA